MKSLQIENMPYCYADKISYQNGVNLVSFIGYSNIINNYEKKMNKGFSMYISGFGSRRYTAKSFDIIKEKIPNSDYTYAVMMKKDIVLYKNTIDEEHNFYIYGVNIQEIKDNLFNKLYENMSLPLLEEWKDAIFNKLLNSGYLAQSQVYIENYDKTKIFYCYGINIKTTKFTEIICNLLKTGEINILNKNTSSEKLLNINGLDSYLNDFGSILATKIQEAFVPKFVPGVDSYSEFVDNYDDSCFEEGIELFDAQKIAIQGCVNNFNTNDFSLVIGEMGTGKTAISLGATYGHYNKNGLNCIIMCPSHLMLKWKREAERFVPNAKGYIINEVSDLIKLEPKIKNKDKKENTYIIVSKDTAKMSYSKSPAAIWSKSKKAFVCPDCGQVLTTTKTVNRRQIEIPMTYTDFYKENSYNARCKNKVIKFDKKNGTTYETVCNASLWGPMTKRTIEESSWIKIKDCFINKHCEDIIKTDFENKGNLTAKETEIYTRIVSGELKNENLRIISRYSIAKYIRERFNGHIDYTILDELHNFANDNSQSQAANDLCSIGSKILGLTGTLLNGYASSLFYILYRAMPKIMKEEGFDYSSLSEFSKTFGVYRETSSYISENSTNRRESVSEKQLPGVSPLVFTKFLLNNSIFLSLSDMSQNLPSYNEIPIEVSMDDELRTSYESLVNELSGKIGRYTQGSSKILGSMLQTLSTYPDMPYDCIPIINPDTAEVVVTPRELPRGNRNKENRFLELIQEKIALGEKVLVYVNWTERTDCQDKLKALLQENNIKASIMTSKNSKSKDREDWIEKQLNSGLQVLICNPQLVETGLDLLDFTTIVFYQIGYKISTLRQASRRSWRLGQEHPIEVYFLYYESTIQEQALSLMATKLQASMAIEGKFSEEGLQAMSNNEDLLTQIANSVVSGIRHTVQANSFNYNNNGTQITRRTNRKKKSELLVNDIIIEEITSEIKEKASKEKCNLVTIERNELLEAFSSRKISLLFL